VVVRARVVEDGAAGGGDAADDAELLEQVERGVDGRNREPGEPRRGGGAELLGGHVTAELDQDLVEDEALGGHPLAAGAEAFGEVLGHEATLILTHLQ
jgi:hypothetical protein